MPVRIVLMIGELEVGGTQRQMLELAKRLDREQFTVEVCVLSRSLAFADEFHRASVALRVLEKHGRYDLVSLYRLRRYFRENKTQVLVTYGFTADAWGRVAARLAGVPVIISSVRTSQEESRLLDWINNLLRPITDHYIVNAPAVSEYLQGIRVSSEKISMIPNGIDLTRFTDIAECREDIRNSLGIPSEAFVVGIVSRLSPEKNVEGFVQVAERFFGHCPEAAFVVVGDGPDRSRLESAAQSAGLEGRTHWLGARKDVPRVLKTFDIALLTSWREGLSNALLEYMAAGLPVIVSDVGGNPVVVTHGRNGYLFPAGDTGKCLEYLLSVYADPDLRRRLGEQSRREVQSRFGTEALVHRTEDLILSLLSGKNCSDAKPRDYAARTNAASGRGD